MKGGTKWGAAVRDVPRRRREGGAMIAEQLEVEIPNLAASG